MIYLLISILVCMWALLGWQVIRLERKLRRTAVNFNNYADAAAKAECWRVLERLAADEANCEDMMHRLEAVEGTAGTMSSRIKALEDGTIPNYEEARKAAKAVDDFNTGLSAIMNFDPMAAAKRAKDEKSAKGGGVNGV